MISAYGKSESFSSVSAHKIPKYAVFIAQFPPRPCFYQAVAMVYFSVLPLVEIVLAAAISQGRGFGSEKL